MREKLDRAVASVPVGAWALGVSGGADSVAMLVLLRARADLGLHVVHLDHEIRGEASREDALFVQDLCQRLSVPCTVARRNEIEAGIADLPANRSARFRAIRLRLFERTCGEHGLQGVILAHHALDQAETVLQRLLRSSGPAGLCGMRSCGQVGRLTILRPFLGIDPDDLRRCFREKGQNWREDASNQSPAYQRNRVRVVLRARAAMAEDLLDLARAMGELSGWIAHAAPRLGSAFAVRELAELPDILAHHAARQWLVDRGAPPEELLPSVTARLMEMARDAASSPRRHFPGEVLVGRRRGVIAAQAPG